MSTQPSPQLFANLNKQRHGCLPFLLIVLFLFLLFLLLVLFRIYDTLKSPIDKFDFILNLLGFLLIAIAAFIAIIGLLIGFLQLTNHTPLARRIFHKCFNNLPMYQFMEGLFFHNFGDAVLQVLEQSSTVSNAVSSLPSSPDLNTAPSPNNHFQGRQIELERICDGFHPPKKASDLRVQAIIGLSGIGTSDLAAKYVQMHDTDYQAIFWVKVTNQSLEWICNDILQQIGKALAKKTTIGDINDNSKSVRPQLAAMPITSSLPANADQASDYAADGGPQDDEQTPPLPEKIGIEKVQVVKEQLKRWEKWLLVLDECKNVDVVRNLMKEFSQGEVGDILVTTDKSDFKVKNIAWVALKGLEPYDGAAFLQTRTQLWHWLSIQTLSKIEKETEKSALQDISKEMGGLPFGLEVAASFMLKQSNCLPSEFLRLYRRSLRLIERHGAQAPTISQSVSAQASQALPTTTDSKYNKTFATIWQFVYTDLLDDQQIGLAAIILLQLCSFLDYEVVPEDRIRQWVKSGKGEHASLFGMACTNFSTSQDFWAAIDELINEAINILYTYSLIDKHATGLVINPVLKAVIREELMTGSSISPAVVEGAVKIVYSVPTIQNEAHKMHPIGWEKCREHLPSLLMCARYARKRELSCTEAIQLLYLASRHYLDGGKYEQARKCLNYIHGKMKDDSHLALVMESKVENALAEVFHMLNDSKQAEEYYQKALASCGQNGLNHAIILNNLGRLYHDRSTSDVGMAVRKYKKALDLYSQQWNLLDNDPASIAQQNKNPDLVANWMFTVSNLTWIYFRRGDFASAQKLYSNTLKTLDTTTAGYKYRIETGQYSGYERMFVGIVKVVEQVLGADHLVTARCYSNVALFYATQQKYAKASDAMKRALSISKPILNNDTHPLIAAWDADLITLSQLQAKPTSGGFEI